MKMKHSLIAMAVAGLAGTVAVAPAMAETTAYGLAQVELTSYSNQTEDGPCDVDGTPASGSDGSADVGKACDGLLVQDKANGRAGIKASEDLGNGWTGLAKIEWQVNYAKGTVNANQDAFHTREAMVGLKGAGVTIEAGMLKSAYKYTGGVKYDPFVATALEARRDNGGMSHTAYGQGGFLPETIAVKGKAGPVKYWLTYGPGEGDGDLTASVMFEHEAFEVFVAMADKGERADAPLGANGQPLPPVGGGIKDAEDDYSATKVGGAYKAGPLKVKLQYEMIEIKNNTPPATPSVEPTYTFVGAEYKMGKNIFVLQLGQYDSDNGGKDTDYLALGVIHKFTKDTRLFAGYRTSDAENDSEEDAITVGLRKDF